MFCHHAGRALDRSRPAAESSLNSACASPSFGVEETGCPAVEDLEIARCANLRKRIDDSRPRVLRGFRTTQRLLLAELVEFPIADQPRPTRSRNACRIVRWYEISAFPPRRALGGAPLASPRAAGVEDRLRHASMGRLPHMAFVPVNSAASAPCSPSNSAPESGQGDGPENTPR